MEKRVLLAVVLSFIVLYGFQAMFPPPEPAPPVRQAPPAAAPRSPGANVPGQSPSQPVTAEPAPVSTPEALVRDARERDIVVENNEVQAVFSSRGGVLTHWRLKRYLGADGKPLDLVPERVPAGSPRPFTLTVGDAAIDETLAQALFKPSVDAVSANSAPGQLAFEYSDASGLTARKDFTFTPTPQQPFVIEVTASVSKGGSPLNPTIHWGAALGTGIVSSGLTYAPSPQPIFYRDRDVTRVGFDDIPKIGRASCRERV